jgi:transposase-like protein
MKRIFRSKLGGSISIALSIRLGIPLISCERAKRDRRTAKRFFSKALKAFHNSSPRVVNIDKNAAYPPAIDEFKASKT